MKKIILSLIYICVLYFLFYSTYCTSIEYNNSSIADNMVLEELRINYEGIVPNFEKNIYKYYLTVPEEVSDIEVLASTKNLNSTIEIKGNTNLKNGLNIIEIEVISEDKEQKNTYTIEVTKTDNIKLANANLEILAIENVLLNPPFDSNITNYEVEVSNETEKVNILAITQNENAKVEIIGAEQLEEGDNLITINVTAPNTFSKRIYTINIHKRNREETIQFLQEQKINEEKLNGIYNVQKTSMQMESNAKTVNNYKEKTPKIILYATALIVVIFIILYFIKLKYRKK